MQPLRVLRQVKIDGRWEKLPVVRNGAQGHGRFDWGKVRRKGVVLPVAEGMFYLEFREDGRKVRRAVGPTAHEVRQAIVDQAAVLALRAQEAAAGVAPRGRAAPPEGKSIAEAIEAFLKSPPLGLREKTLTKYRFELRTFQRWARTVRKTHLSQLGRQDIRDFMAWLVRGEGRAVKTAVNKGVIVLKLLRDAGAAIEMKKGDWPRVTEEQPDVYTPEMLKPLFAACRPQEFALYQTFLLTGFRDQEVGFVAWPDFNPRAATLKVSKKTGYKFDPKNYMERTVPIPPALVAILEQQQQRQLLEGRKPYFVFPTSDQNVGAGMPGGQRDKHMLLKLKKVALRAGLNCGRCRKKYLGKPASCADKPVCGEWTLHKFRHTYATALLREGFDILTVQKLLGHRKIESTMKYLRMLQPESLSEKMNGAAIATMFV
jgi:integrase